MKKLLLFLFVVSAIFHHQASAQPTDQNSSRAVSGVVMDTESNLPIEYATVAVFSLPDSVLVAGSISNEMGFFQIETLDNGQYMLKVDFLGYDPVTSNFSITTEKPSFRAGKILLSVSSQVLDGVQITAEKSYFQQSIDKKVYNIDKDIVASSGTASEALQNIPSVTVDIDGNVSLRGNSNVRIFIDGKPSGLMGNNMTAILEQIPANTIESIEVVTNPSARYEAEGSGGIINIVLKKDKKLGLNGVATIGGSTFPGYDASLSLNYRDKKWNLFTSYSLDNRTRDGYSSVNRSVLYEDSLSYYNSNGSSTDGRDGQGIRAGADYYINDKNTIGISGYYGVRSSESSDLNYYRFFDNDSILDRENIRTGSGYGDNTSYNIGLNYRKVFSNVKHVLTMDAFLSNGSGNDISSYEEKSYDLMGLEIDSAIFQNILSDDVNQDINIQTDYVHPFNNGNQFEAGVKYVREFRDNDLASESFDYSLLELTNDDSISNQFRFDLQIISAYAIWNSSIGKLGYQLGLRAEQTILLSELVTTSEVYDRDYLGLFPSAHFQYKLKEGMELNASYSRRINRPRSFFLNPFPEFSDPYTYRQGNPFLDPEYEHSFEIGYTKTWEKHTLSSSVFFKHTNGEFSAYTEVDSNGLSRTSFENFSSEDAYGMEFVSRNEFFKWWTATSSLNVNRTILDASNIEEGLSNTVTNYNARVMMVFKVLEQTSLQLTYNYWRPWVMAQGVPQPFTFLDAGIRSDFLNNKLTLNISVSDLFNTREFMVSNSSYNFTQQFNRKRESRALTLRLSYKFGAQDNSRRRNGQGGDFDNGGGEMF